MPTVRFFSIALLLLMKSTVADAQSAHEFFKEAQKALRAGNRDEALALATKAVLQDPKDTTCLAFRATLQDKMGRHKEALADFSKVIELEPDRADGYQLRGCVHFKLARFDDSIKDFDKFIELNPKAKASHWQRGISYYYAGRFDDGKKQFEGYQTFDSNDVENAVWRFMCMAKVVDIQKARADMLKIGDDTRIPMKQVYDMFAGKIKPSDVLAAARVYEPPIEKRGLFYANLYVGIHFDLEGDPKKALSYLNHATEDYRVDHYMWDVARVHRDLLKKRLEKK